MDDPRRLIRAHKAVNRPAQILLPLAAIRNLGGQMSKGPFIKDIHTKGGKGGQKQT